MPKFKLIAMTTPVAGKEDVFNEWYQTTHLVEVCTLPGVQSAQRYELAAKMSGADNNQWMALYDLELDDPQTFLRALGEAMSGGKMTMTDSIAPGAYTALFTERGEPVVAA
jgi:hypothetical protein